VLGFLSFKRNDVVHLVFHSTPSDGWHSDWIRQYQFDQAIFYGFVDFLYPEDEVTITDCSNLSQTIDQIERLKRLKRCVYRLHLIAALVPREKRQLAKNAPGP
jgi:hypothetical protein